MKRVFLFGGLFVLAGVLAGCPIYDDDHDGNDECGPYSQHGEDHSCDDDPPPSGCTGPEDCGVNETCGADQQCHVGDCTLWGCPADQTCEIADDLTASCVDGGTTSTSTNSGGGGAGGSGGAGGAGGTGGGGDEVWCGNPDDCAEGETCAPDGTCQPGDCSEVGCIFGYTCGDTTPPACEPSNPAACGADEDCIEGSACVSGICTAPADQCFDQTQCGGAQLCADGKCVAECDDDTDCPSGYACDLAVGICSNPATPCTITNDCGGPDLVCVDGACVDRSDGGTCPEGEVWVENGCIPNQSATFVCNQDGVQDACAAGSICLHHSCYISCAAPNETACDNLPSFNVCKTVTTSSGDHPVCGSNDNLGGECDPTAGLGCPGAGEICIDGFCK